MINGKSALRKDDIRPRDHRQDEINAMLMLTESCYHRQAWDEPMIGVWHEVLKSYELTAIRAAFACHVRQSAYLPLIKDILDILTKGELDITARANEQWRIVMDAVRSGGLNRKPTFDDPITADLVKRQFSWQYMCGIEDDQIKWELKRWVDAFVLAAEIPANQRAIEAPAKVKALISSIGAIED